MRKLLAGVLCGLLSWPLCLVAETLPTAAELEALATAITERQAEVQSLTLRAHVAAMGAGARLLMHYQAPGKYRLYLSRARDGAAYTALVEQRVDIYDFAHGDMLRMDGLVPAFRFGHDGQSIQANWSFHATPEKQAPATPTEEPEVNIVLDFASLFRNPAVVKRQVEALGGSRYRLTQFTQKGSRLDAVFNTASPFAVEQIDVRVDQRLMLSLTLTVNDPSPLALPELPNEATLLASFRLGQKPANLDPRFMLRLAGLSMLPLLTQAGEEYRNSQAMIEALVGESLPWEDIQRRYRDNLPELRRLYPMP